MQLKEFSLIIPLLEAQAIFPAIQTLISPEAIGFAASQAERDRLREKQKSGVNIF